MPFTDAELEAFLSEALPPEAMADLEKALRADTALAERLAAVNARLSAGIVSVGDLWRRLRLTCPTREQLGSYLLGAQANELAGYIRFHLETIGCRYCQANRTDLENRESEETEASATRRRRYFQSSVGHLRRP